MKESSKYTVAQPSKQLHIESLGHAKYHLSPASVFAAQWQIHHMLPQMEEKPVTVWLSLSEKSKFESLRILTTCSELQTLPYLPCLLQFADKCLSHKWKEGKQPPCRQLFRVFYREAQALCQKEMISIWLFRRSKQQLLGKKCTWDHPRWRFLARQESGIMACHRGNLQRVEVALRNACCMLWCRVQSVYLAYHVAFHKRCYPEPPPFVCREGRLLLLTKDYVSSMLLDKSHRIDVHSWFLLEESLFGDRWGSWSHCDY